MKAESTEMCSWKEKSLFEILLSFCIMNQNDLHQKIFLVRKVGHFRTLVAIKTDEF